MACFESGFHHSTEREAAGCSGAACWWASCYCFLIKWYLRVCSCLWPTLTYWRKHDRGSQTEEHSFFKPKCLTFRLMKSKRIFGFLQRVNGAQFVLAVLLLSSSSVQAHRPRKPSAPSVAQKICTRFSENWPSEVIRRGLGRNVNDSVTWMQTDKTILTGRR